VRAHRESTRDLDFAAKIGRLPLHAEALSK